MPTVFSAIVPHVFGMAFAPYFLAVAALLPVRRIVLELLLVILSPPSTLAIAPATDDLVRMIPRGLEQLSTVRAARKRHVYQSHGLRWLADFQTAVKTLSRLMGLPVQ
jgi:hypothetical protein